MHINIFYSWQSDLPNKYNRGFIQACLEQALRSLSHPENYYILKLDRDTEGVEGAPDIVHTIFEKIAKSNIFIADISIINLFDSHGRKVPNPNVLLELGFAAASLGWERIILIYNLDYGRIEDLPFDLKSRRPIFYKLSADSEPEKTSQKKLLSSTLASAIFEIAQKVRFFEDHPVTKLYPFYHSRITRIYLECENFFDELVNEFISDEESGDFSFLPSSSVLDKLIKTINEKLSNVSLQEILDDGDTTFEELWEGESHIDIFSIVLEENIEHFLERLTDDIEDLLKFKDGIDLNIISILVKILSENESSFYLINSRKHYTLSAGNNEKRQYVINYIQFNSYRISMLFNNIFNLKKYFGETYALHKEEFERQEREKYNSFSKFF